MSYKVKESAALLLGSVIIYAWFAHRMLNGWYVADQSAGAVFEVVIAVFILTAIVYGTAAGVLAATNRDKTSEDERDAAIDAKAARNELFVLNALINTFVLLLLGQTAFNGPSLFNEFDLHIAFDHLPTLIFILFSTLWVGEWVRLGSLLWYARL